jgi:hypothetical protein
MFFRTDRQSIPAVIQAVIAPMVFKTDYKKHRQSADSAPFRDRPHLAPTTQNIKSVIGVRTCQWTAAQSPESSNGQAPPLSRSRLNVKECLDVSLSGTVKVCLLDDTR